MLHTYHRSISLEFFKQCCNHSLTCFGNHKNKCCYIHNNVTNINKISMGAFLWKSTRQILVISITTSQTQTKQNLVISITMSQTRPAALSKNINNLQDINFDHNFTPNTNHIPFFCTRYIHNNVANISRNYQQCRVML